MIFLWLRDGRPAALGCIFSQPHGRLPGRKVLHEFHALDPEKLLVTRDALNEWKPEAGLARKELTDAAAPAATARGAADPDAEAGPGVHRPQIDGQEKKRWELRLLPTPLYRYPAAKTGVIDGALFALVSDAGTDPEVLLAHRGPGGRTGKCAGSTPAAASPTGNCTSSGRTRRFGRPSRARRTPPSHDPQHLYRLYPDKVVTLEGKLLARVRPTPEKPWGEVIPVEEK